MPNSGTHAALACEALKTREMKLWSEGEDALPAEIRNSDFDEFHNSDFASKSMHCVGVGFKALLNRELSASEALLRSATWHDAKDNGGASRSTPILVKVREKPAFLHLTTGVLPP